MTSKKFHIKVPYYSAWQKFGWIKGEAGIGLSKKRIDKLAETDEEIIVKIGADLAENKIKARKIQQYPFERVKNTNVFVYVVPKSLFFKKISQMSQEELFDWSH